MEWVLRSPQFHSTFSNLGFAQADGYHVNKNCNAVLESILHNLQTEDKYLRIYRRSISFGQNVQKDLIPLLIHANEDKTIELLIKILVNLTIPVECLFSIDVMSKSDFGSHTIFEINNLLTATKAAFTDQRATRVIVEFLKKNFEIDQKVKLPAEMCENVNNGLLLLRNILHIPDDSHTSNANYNSPPHAVQNQILWNIFSQSIDKILIKLMNIPDAAFWGVTMVQLVALLYKDQHVVTLHKLLNLWLEKSLSESSEDNESNTSPPDRAGSEVSSPIMTSDSSDTGVSGKSNDEPNSINNEWNTNLNEQMNDANDNDQISQMDIESEKQIDVTHKKEKSEKQEPSDKTEETSTPNMTIVELEQTNHQPQASLNFNNTPQENSDCGYVTQIGNQGTPSTSSNDDDLPTKKPVHQKPHNPKQRANTKVRSAGINLQDRKRKRIVKRGKSNSMSNIQGLNHYTPTDDDISNILKEFTVDFLLKGYNSLVQTLLNEILTNSELEIDTSHFFWLVTYFLKFATQIELDFEHVSSVLSYEIVSYLTAEGVNLCEQFELTIKLDGKNLKPSIRRLHLIVTALREFVQAVKVYKNMSCICKEDQDALTKLQIKMCETEELRSLLVLLIRYYNPKYNSKQYLQDLIVTNHIYIMFLDGVMKLPDYNGSQNIIEHIKLFSTPDVMYQYGLLLEDFKSNGEFVNDCIFTLMHHVGGDLDCLISLFQPKILKIFTLIWQSEFEICDDWSDLIQYVINTFIKKPHTLQSKVIFRLNAENFEIDSQPEPGSDKKCHENKKIKLDSGSSNKPSKDIWTEKELSSLNWNYTQSKTMPDVIGEIIRLFKEDGIVKTRYSVVQELYKQNVINKQELDGLSRSGQNDSRDDEIGKLCEHLIQDGKAVFLDWVQKVLLDMCYVKMYLDSKALSKREPLRPEVKLLHFECFKKKADELPVMSAVSYHALVFSKSVPLVPWNSEQAAICKDLKFLQLLHKIGLQMPVDTGKVFIRIPHFWSSETLYEIAGKIAFIDTNNLKFRPNVPVSKTPPPANTIFESFCAQDVVTTAIPNNYQIHKPNNLATMVSFTPKPSSSYIPEKVETQHNWLEIIQKSQEYKNNAIIERPSSSYIPEKVETQHNWLEIIQKSQEYKNNANIERPSSSYIPEKVETQHNWLKIIQKSQEYKNNAIIESYETASVASDLTRMYVSDEDEKPEPAVVSCASLTSNKRLRLSFTLPL